MNSDEQLTFFGGDPSHDVLFSVQPADATGRVYARARKMMLESAGLSRIWREPEWSHYARLRFHGMNVRDAAEGAGKKLPVPERVSDEVEGRVIQAKRYLELGFNAREAVDLAGFPGDEEVIQKLFEVVNDSNEAFRIRYEQTRKWMGSPA
jgi:hypothetical protein